MPQTQKGNPASHRMSNANLKAKRAASWSRGEKRKLERAAKQKVAHQVNQSTGTSPWKEAKARRYAKRH